MTQSIVRAVFVTHDPSVRDATFSIIFYCNKTHIGSDVYVKDYRSMCNTAMMLLEARVKHPDQWILTALNTVEG